MEDHEVAMYKRMVREHRGTPRQVGAGSTQSQTVRFAVLIDVLDSQRAFNETMSTYYGAQADYRRAMSRLASAAGQEAIP